jgi:hypothetical protein
MVLVGGAQLIGTKGLSDGDIGPVAVRVIPSHDRTRRCANRGALKQRVDANEEAGGQVNAAVSAAAVTALAALAATGYTMVPVVPLRS